jgi:hypothetical protein
VTLTLNAQVNANGGSDSAVSFQWGTGTTYGNSIAATPATLSGSTATGVSANLDATANLLINSIYHYRAVVTGGGQTWYGNDITFVTSNDPFTGIQVEDNCATNSTQTIFTVFNANSFDVSVGYQDGSSTGSIDVGAGQWQDIYVPINSFASFLNNFYQNNPIFLQQATNNQMEIGDTCPMIPPSTMITVVPAGTNFLGNLEGGNETEQFYYLYNLDTVPVTVSILSGPGNYTVTLPAANPNLPLGYNNSTIIAGQSHFKTSPGVWSGRHHSSQRV